MAALGLGSSTGEIESPEIESLCNERSAEDNDGDIGLGFRPGNVSCSNSLDEILVSYFSPEGITPRILLK